MLPTAWSVTEGALERSAGEMLEQEERSVMVFGVQHTFLGSAPDGWSM